ncbi:Snf7-domain-containing protein, partial [Globomyces pollinis-pini]
MKSEAETESILDSLKSLDKDRISALYSKFPVDRTNYNATSYDDKLKFWTNLIQKAIDLNLFKSRLSIQSWKLDRVFEIHHLTPLGLNTVMTNLIFSGDIVNEQDFLNDTSIAHTFVLNPLKWVWNKVSGQPNEEVIWTEKQISFIFLPYLKQICQEILTLIYQQDKLVLTLKDLQDLILELGISSEKDIEIILRNFKLQQLVLSTVDSKMTIYKFKPKDATLSDITEVEIGIVKMQQTIKQLNDQIHDMEQSIIQFKNEAKENVKLGNKPKALYMLQKNKKLNELISKRLASLDTLESIIMKIGQSKTDIEVIDSFKLGTETLSTILKSKQLQLDYVEDTMDNLNEVLADQKEIEETMTLNLPTTIDDDDLELELNQLLQKELEKVESVVTPTSIHTDQSTVPLGASDKVDVDGLVSELNNLTIPKSDLPKEKNTSESSNSKILLAE